MAAASTHKLRWASGALIVVLVGGAIVLFVGCCGSRSVSVRQAPVRQAAMTAPPDTVSLGIPPCVWRGEPCGPPGTDAAGAVPPASVPDSVTLVEMKNVHLRLDRVLALWVYSLRGTMAAQEDWKVVNFNYPRSFVIDIYSAVVGVRPRDLRYLLNAYVFSYPGAPLTIHQVRATGDRLVLDGTLHKIIDIPFEITATLEALPTGWIRLHPVEIEICGLPGKGLLKAVGLTLEEFIDLSKAEAVRAEGNNLLLDPDRALPPPAIRGHLASVRVEENMVVLIYRPADDAPSDFDMPPPPIETVENYMFFRGGVIRFGQLYMVHTDLQLIDTDPQDAFDFFLTHYKAQLVAGYSETLPDFGLKAYMPDFEAVGTSVSAEEQRPPPADSTLR